MRFQVAMLHAKRMKTARWWLEFVVLVIGALWGLGELVQGAYNPAAELLIKSVDRVGPRSSGAMLVVSITFRVSRARLRLTGADLGVDPGMTGKYTPSTCEQLRALPGRGLFPSGDATEVACIVPVANDVCVGLRVIVRGRRAVPVVGALWPEASWTSTTISCPHL